MVHSVRKSLAEHGDKLDAGEKEKIEAALKDVEEAIKGDDKAAIDAKTEALMTPARSSARRCTPTQAAAAARWGGRRGRAPAQAAGLGIGRVVQAGDDNVVDAEFKEVKK
jgi:molecular chaperone DnaK